MAWSAARNAASGPFWFTAPRPMKPCRNPACRRAPPPRAASDHSAGVDLLDVVHEVETDRSRRAGIQRGEDAGLAVRWLTSSTRRKPASRELLHREGATLLDVLAGGGDGRLLDPALQARNVLAVLLGDSRVDGLQIVGGVRGRDEGERGGDGAEDDESSHGANYI